MNIKEFKENCLGYLEDTLCSTTKEEFEALLGSSEEAKNELESFKAVYNLASSVSAKKENIEINLESAVMNKIKDSSKENSKEKESKKGLLDFLVPALAFGAVAGLALVFTTQIGKQSSKGFHLVGEALERAGSTRQSDNMVIASAPKEVSRVEKLAILSESKDSRIVAKRGNNKSSRPRYAGSGSIGKPVVIENDSSSVGELVQALESNVKSDSKSEQEIYQDTTGSIEHLSRKANQFTSTDGLEPVIFPESDVPSPPAPPFDSVSSQVESEEIEKRVRSRMPSFAVSPGREKLNSIKDRIRTQVRREMNLPDIDYDAKPIKPSRPTIKQKPFKKVSDAPLSTFSIDVDTASYTNVRQFLNRGVLPPAEAVRLEEMVNYFNYDYPKPSGDKPFNVVAQISSAPWNEKRLLAHIGLQGKEISREERSSSNLVFLVDVSGSMRTTQKLPLLKKAFKPLVDELEEDDKVSIVTYANGTRVVLEPTSDKEKIIRSLNSLRASGGTNGAGGIKLAYQQAKDAFIKGGNNRVIVATDGDFNVGVSSKAGLDSLIKEKRDDGIFLTVLGFGVQRYQDSKMESLANKGNGNYFYIDNFKEAHKVFSSDLLGTIFTIAKDVKIQVEFNPSKVKGYRLLGYETRALKARDFNNDKKDAGELGSGHTVTALYELIPIGSKEEFPDEDSSIDPLRYGKKKEVKKDLVQVPTHNEEIMNVKLRYKNPDEETSKLIEKPIKEVVHKLEKTTNEFRFAASVAEFAMNLKHGARNYDKIITLAQNARGKDTEGTKAEFVSLVKMAKSLDTSVKAKDEVKTKKKQKEGSEEKAWSPWQK